METLTQAAIATASAIQCPGCQASGYTARYGQCGEELGDGDATEGAIKDLIEEACELASLANLYDDLREKQKEQTA